MNEWQSFLGEVAYSDDISLLFVSSNIDRLKSKQVYTEAKKCFLEKDYAKALELALEAKSLVPSMPRNLYLLTAIFVKMKKFIEAKAELETYLATIGEAHAKAWLIMGQILLKLRDIDTAKLSFKRAISLDRQLTSAHYGLIMCYIRKKEWPKAQKTLKQAEKQLPGDNTLKHLLSHVASNIEDSHE